MEQINSPTLPSVISIKPFYLPTGYKLSPFRYKTPKDLSTITTLDNSKVVEQVKSNIKIEQLRQYIKRSITKIKLDRQKQLQKRREKNQEELQRKRKYIQYQRQRHKQIMILMKQYLLVMRKYYWSKQPLHKQYCSLSTSEVKQEDIRILKTSKLRYNKLTVIANNITSGIQHQKQNKNNNSQTCVIVSKESKQLKNQYFCLLRELQKKIKQCVVSTKGVSGLLQDLMKTKQKQANDIMKVVSLTKNNWEEMFKNICCFKKLEQKLIIEAQKNNYSIQYNEVDKNTKTVLDEMFQQLKKNKQYFELIQKRVQEEQIKRDNSQKTSQESSFITKNYNQKYSKTKNHQQNKQNSLDKYDKQNKQNQQNQHNKYIKFNKQDKQQKLNYTSNCVVKNYNKQSNIQGYSIQEIHQSSQSLGQTTNQLIQNQQEVVETLKKNQSYLTSRKKLKNKKKLLTNYEDKSFLESRDSKVNSKIYGIQPQQLQSRNRVTKISNINLSRNIHRDMFKKIKSQPKQQSLNRMRKIKKKKMKRKLLQECFSLNQIKGWEEANIPYSELQNSTKKYLKSKQQNLLNNGLQFPITTYKEENTLNSNYKKENIYNDQSQFFFEKIKSIKVKKILQSKTPEIKNKQQAFERISNHQNRGVMKSRLFQLFKRDNLLMLREQAAQFLTMQDKMYQNLQTQNLAKNTVQPIDNFDWVDLLNFKIQCVDVDMIDLAMSEKIKNPTTSRHSCRYQQVFIEFLKEKISIPQQQQCQKDRLKMFQIDTYNIKQQKSKECSLQILQQIAS